MLYLLEGILKTSNSNPSRRTKCPPEKSGRSAEEKRRAQRKPDSLLSRCEWTVRFQGFNRLPFRCKRWPCAAAFRARRRRQHPLWGGPCPARRETKEHKGVHFSGASRARTRHVRPSLRCVISNLLHIDVMIQPSDFRLRTPEESPF
jgi:hypothetical protein